MSLIRDSQGPYCRCCLERFAWIPGRYRNLGNRLRPKWEADCLPNHLGEYYRMGHTPIKWSSHDCQEVSTWVWYMPYSPNRKLIIIHSEHERTDESPTQRSTTLSNEGATFVKRSVHIRECVIQVLDHYILHMKRWQFLTVYTNVRPIIGWTRLTSW